ncbi:hypothetical protein TNCV_3206891 [Trichonephila clavipes]|nr:hypothetical protein TNCV_3206891 [Trichonephila clavipes]
MEPVLPYILEEWISKNIPAKKEERDEEKKEERRREREEPDLGWRKGKSPALDGESMRESPGWNGREESAREKGLV